MKVTAEEMAAHKGPLTADTCGKCDSRANVPSNPSPGWHCVCGHFNLGCWRVHNMTAWDAPDYGPPAPRAAKGEGP